MSPLISWVNYPLLIPSWSLDRSRLQLGLWFRDERFWGGTLVGRDMDRVQLMELALPSNVSLIPLFSLTSQSMTRIHWWRNLLAAQQWRCITLQTQPPSYCQKIPSLPFQASWRFIRCIARKGEWFQLVKSAAIVTATRKVSCYCKAGPEFCDCYTSVTKDVLQAPGKLTIFRWIVYICVWVPAMHCNYFDPISCFSLLDLVTGDHPADNTTEPSSRHCRSSTRHCLSFSRDCWSSSRHRRSSTSRCWRLCCCWIFQSTLYRRGPWGFIFKWVTCDCHGKQKAQRTSSG